MAVWDDDWEDSEVEYVRPRTYATIGLVAVQVVGLFLSPKTVDAFRLTYDTAVERTQLWRFVTYGFAFDVQGYTFLYFLPMMALMFLFGRELETKIGGIRLCLLFLATTIMGGVAHILTQSLTHESSPALGNLMAGPCAVIMAAAVLQPNKHVRFYFFVPTSLLIAGLLTIAVTAIYVAAHFRSGTAILPLIVSSLLAMLAFHLGPWFDGATDRLRGKFVRLRADREDDLRRHVDEILDKISRSGLPSLSRTELKLLKKASRTFAEKYRD